MRTWLKRLFGSGSDSPADAGQGESQARHEEQERKRRNDREQQGDHKRQGDVHLQQGRLEQAAQSYGQAIELDAGDAQSQLNLGFVRLQQQRLQEAQGHLEQALGIEPQLADGHYFLGSLLQQQGQWERAGQHYAQAIAVKPDFDVARLNFGLSLFQCGDVAQARKVIEAGVARNPEHPDFHYYLGNICMHENEMEKAVACFERALALHPDYAEIHNNLGRAQQAQSRSDAAIESYRRAIALRPDYADAYGNLALALQSQEKSALAIENHRRALSIDPSQPHLHNNLGLALWALGKWDEAIDSYRAALALNADFAEAYNNLGLVLREKGDLEAAIECHRQALLRKPDLASAHNNLGLALHEQGEIEQATASYENALALKPDDVDAHSNLGGALLAMGELALAIECYRKVLSIKPDYRAVHSNLLFAMTGHAGTSAAQYLEEAKRYGAAAAAQAKPYTQWDSDYADTGVLRIGFVSGDLRSHPVSFFLESILAQFDRRQVQLVAYPTTASEDSVTARLRPHFGQWHCLHGLSDAAAAAQVHGDRIDILIDLAGHSAHNRLSVFAWKAAPIQVSWLGYLASTGLKEMDYVLADRITLPPEHQAHFTEKAWYLPETVNCLTPPTAADALLPPLLPALANGYVTFASFQAMGKISDQTLALWSKVLQALPQAKLRLQSRVLHQQATRAVVLKRLARAGIPEERVELAGAIASHAHYLEKHHQVDIVLDTFPYPGITTTCEALWMGVPTVTLTGQSLLARQGASLMACAGLGDWVARDPEHYLELALKHAGDLQGLSQLRAGLRQRAIDCPLFDAPRFAANLTAAWLGMHEAGRSL